MAIDNLTQRLKEELASRGRIVSDAQIEAFLNERENPSPTTTSRQVTGGPVLAEDVDPQEAKSSVLNAVGAGLWSALDVAAFGVPGAFVKEEEFLDFVRPLAKWTGAIGGFAGVCSW